MGSSKVKQQYEYAKEQYAQIGVDTDKALDALQETEISVNCWQGDDVTGFEPKVGELSGGILATGDYPGKARNADELRSDLEKTLTLIPGRQRLNLHANYLETGGKIVERDEVEVKYFERWMQWAKENDCPLDFNTTMFSHPKADNYTLASYDKGIRDFWIEHGRRVRDIGQKMGEQQDSPCVINHWMIDGSKNAPVDRYQRRKLFVESLDRIMEKPIPKEDVLDSIESKLFGIGLESFTAGSGEVAFGYALTRDIMVTFDMGHFHPTESVADKISSALLFMDKFLLHTSRPVRWDSDHVVLQNDDLLTLMQEVVRAEALDKVYIALDVFDASINRIASWVISTRSTQRAILAALLEPSEMLLKEEMAGNSTWRMALLEEQKNMPLHAVWDYFCEKNNVPVGSAWIDEVKTYEKDILFKRD